VAISDETVMADGEADVNLIRLYSYLNGFSKEAQQDFLALYILLGVDLLFVLYTLRGKSISFPSSRRFRRISRELREGEYEVISDKAVVKDRRDRVVPVSLLRKGADVKYKGSSWTVAADSVQLADVHFALLMRKNI
jgi:hypothetical protein